MLAGLLVAATAWYVYLFDPTGGLAAWRLRLCLAGLPPVAAAVWLALRRETPWFLPIACVAVAMLCALRSPVHPLSPDISFHMGKTMWAAAGKPLVDPVIGVESGYPATFHIVWGTLARWTASDPAMILRWISSLNLIGLWLVVWHFARRFAGRDLAATALWVCGLTLFAKDVSEVLFSSPGSFSMPFAALGWCIFVSPSRPLTGVLGAASLGFAVLIWPTHLFAAAGVALVCGWRLRKSLSAWIYAFATTLAVLVIFWMRAAVREGESWSGLQLIPADLADFVLQRLTAFASLGTHSYGWLAGLSGTALLVIFLYLSRLGWQARTADSGFRSLVRLCLGILIGVMLAGWFMVTVSHMVRLEFLACLALVPLAAVGVRRLWSERTWGALLSSARLWGAALALVWLVPFLLAAAATTQRLNQWQRRSMAVSHYLAAHSLPGERVWASPATFRAVALGKVPLLGFMAHDSPLYFGAPRGAAFTFAESYARILHTASVDSALLELNQTGTTRVIVDEAEPDGPAWYPPSDSRLARDTTINSYALWRVSAGN